MCFVLISLMRSELLSVMCLLWWGLIKAMQAQGIKPTKMNQQQQHGHCYPVKHKSAAALPTQTAHQLLTNHVGSEGERVAVSSPHLEATGMLHRTVTASPWVTGVEDPLSRLCECRISKSKAPDQTLQRTHNTLPGNPRITQQTADSSGQIRGLRQESCSETQWHS